ncbi:MAG TPA: hypothetical protein VF773_03185 [Verrucomicrobiae bacterium]
MIQLHPDCLIFRTSQGELIPCSAESVTIELIGDASSLLDPEIVREAAAAVVHYFKEDLHQHTVSVGEFSEALERALKIFGFEVTTTALENGRAPAGVDLRELAAAADDFELSFFKQLRDEFQKQAAQESTEVLRFCGLRGSVKQILGAKRWCQRCEQFSDQVVAFLRNCLSIEGGSPARSLVVR